MLLNEPTQGVDIGARREIFKLVRATVSDGVAVLCATSDYEQLVEMADRVIILSNGRLNGELVGDVAFGFRREDDMVELTVRRRAT